MLPLLRNSIGNYYLNYTNLLNNRERERKREREREYNGKSMNAYSNYNCIICNFAAYNYFGRGPSIANHLSLGDTLNNVSTYIIKIP